MRKVLYIILCAGLCLFALLQSYTTLNDYARLWHRAFWRMRADTSFERSAVFHLKPAGADYMEFIQSIVPPGGKLVVVPGEVRGFSHQGILHFFLLDRVILACGATEAELLECISEPDYYVPAIGSFPPVSTIAGKIFIPYDQGTDFRGIYVPANAEPYQPPPEPFYHPVLTLFFDLLIVLALCALGGMAGILLLNRVDAFEGLMLGFPLGLGIFTWVLFMGSWAGGRIEILTICLMYLVLAGGLYLASRKIFGAPALSKMPGSLGAQVVSGLRSLTRVDWLILAGIGVLFSVAAVIAIGKGYSLYDDMAIWSLKGYVIAQKGTIFAAGKASGHGLAYPMNISLGVTIFRLFTGDLLPGSKLIFPLLTGSLLLHCYWFWRKQGTSRILALLGAFLLISVPMIFQYTTFGFANLPFTAYLVAGTLWSVSGFQQKNFREVLMGGVLFSLAGWTRPEGIGFAYVMACVVIPFFFWWRPRLRQVAAWLVCAGSLSGIWMLFAAPYLEKGQIGGALRAFFATWQTNEAAATVLQQFAYQADYSFSRHEMWGWIVPAALVLLSLSIPKAIREKDLAGWVLVAAAITSAAVPAVLFFVASFTEPDYPLFLSVSFDRAYFPAVFFLVLAAITFSRHWQPAE